MEIEYYPEITRVPHDMILARNGHVLLADYKQIVDIDLSSGMATRLSQDGLLFRLEGIVQEKSGALVVSQAKSLVRVNRKTGKQTELASGGLLQSAGRMAVGPQGDLFVLDSDRVLRVDPSTGAQSLFSAGGLLSGAVDLAIVPPLVGPTPTPTPIPPPPSQAEIKLQLKFNKPSKDKIQVKIKDWQLPAGVAPTSVTVNVGGASFTGRLDGKGKYKSGDGRDSMLMKQSKKTQLWKLTVKRKKNDFAADLADDGLTDADNPKPGVPVTVPLTVEVGGAVYGWDVDLLYKSKLGKKGTAK
jgi:hypothetical protein